MFLLDTNLVSELRKAKCGKADPAVTAGTASLLPASLYLSAITILELETGIRGSNAGIRPRGAEVRGILRAKMAK